MREYLKSLRLRNGWTQKYAAQQVGVGQTYYGYIESSERQARMAYQTMEKLAAVFDVYSKLILSSKYFYIK